MKDAMNQPKNPLAATMITLFISLIGSFALVLGGVALTYAIGLGAYENMMTTIYLVASVLLVLSVATGYAMGKIYISRLNKISVADRIDMMKSRQSATRQNLDKAEKALRRVQGLYTFTYVWYVLLVLILTLTAYTSNVDNMIIRCVLPLVCWWMLPMHLRHAKIKYDFSNYASREDFPVIYGVAEAARDELGLKGDIKILFQNDSNAGIAKIGKVYSLQIGLQLWTVLTQEEIYQVLIHEFAHMTDTHVKNAQGARLTFQRLAESEQLTFPLVPLTLYCRVKFLFENMMYQLLASEQMETTADAHAITHGDPHVAVSALCKTAMTTFYEREFDKFIPEPFHAPENPRDNIATMQCQAFRHAVETRGQAWMQLMELELPPQVQTHPTFKQRREALGVADTPITLTLPDMDSPYGKECQAAAAMLDKKLLEMVQVGYAEAREENYLKPLGIIEDYLNASIPYTTAELSPVINAYRDLARRDEALAICEQILATETNKYATAHALYFKGRCLLTNYDPAGIDCLYQAMDLNMNYAEEGLEAIGEFCCMMGLEAEREVYRKKYVEMTQERIDKFDQAGELNPTDHLVAENFPDDRLEAMLLFMKRAGNGCIWQIYLVRKVITHDFFASAFVIRFVDGTPADQINKSMEAIFNFLDTTPEDWQYSLFLYDKSMERTLQKVPTSCVWDCNKV